MSSKAIIVCGLAFGDEGKGTIVDYLTRREKAHTVIRFNGGAQAAHNVVTDNGRHHTFAQFGSGTLAGARTHLSRHMLVNPTTLINEEDALRRIGFPDAFDRLTIDREALVTTPWHMMANRLRELARGDGKHGTCGMGIGETVSWSLDNPAAAVRVGDLLEHHQLESKLEAAKQRFLSEFPDPVVAFIGAPDLQSWLALAKRVRIVDGEHTRKVLTQEGTVIFEGAQGVLLDETYGFQPHSTWSKTTFENADALIAEARSGLSSVRRLGVLRSYMTRHGTGPLVTESSLRRPEPHNGDSGHQGAFRTGELDFPALNYSLRCVAGVDELAVTHMDRVPEHVCLAYTTEFRPDAAYLATCRPLYARLRFASAGELGDVIQSELNAPVTIKSFGPRPGQKTSTKWT